MGQIKNIKLHIVTDIKPGLTSVPLGLSLHLLNNNKQQDVCLQGETSPGGGSDHPSHSYHPHLAQCQEFGESVCRVDQRCKREEVDGERTRSSAHQDSANYNKEDTLWWRFKDLGSLRDAHPQAFDRFAL